MSFADSVGNYWSILFDGGDPATTMNSVIQAIVAIIAHLLSHNNAETPDPSVTSIRRLLPPNGAAASEDAAALISGMAAGIYLTVYEVGDWADYPTDFLTNSKPLYKIQAPDEVAKVK